jgi:predicted dehydrogenase
MSPERRQYVNDLYPIVRTVASAEEVLSDPTIDAVVIATPVATHADLALQALRAGKHILVENRYWRSRK